ncbi:MAG: hypothetical protein U5J99_03755 [Parvularculaceae bacterium]|nr:hypothetical protein [Parvularculaceae bacterium]
MGTFSNAAFAPRPQASGEQRSEALAERRRQSSADLQQRAAEAAARSTDRLAEVREAVARVLGANTRLSIARTDAFDFVYRAIDVNTGEVINEWPQAVFVDLIRGVGEDVRADVDAGTFLDRVA